MCRSLWLAWHFLVLALAAGVPVLCRAKANDVLVIYSQFRLLQDNLQVDTGLMRPGDLLPTSAVRFYTEYLDYPYFTGEDYERQTAQYLADKYAVSPPKVVVAGGDIALKFILQYRDLMFPGVPIVHLGVSRQFLGGLGALPPDVAGVPVDFDVDGTIDLARELHPKAKRLVFVSGASLWAQDRRSEIGEALARRQLSIPVEFWTGLSTENLLAQLRTLERDSIVFTPGYFLDGAGAAYTPLDSVRLMASVSPAPIYTVYSSLIGAGVVGGRMSTYEDMGKTARVLIDDLLDGKPTGPTLSPVLATQVHLDWRQIEKFELPSSRLPADAVLHFRMPTFWEAYRTQALTAASIGLAQGMLILALLVERRRRQKTASELVDAQRRMAVTTKAARLTPFVWELGSRERDASASDAAQRFEDVLSNVHVSDRERLRIAAQHTLDANAELEVEYRVSGSDGQQKWIASRGQVAAGGGRQITGINMDVSDWKKAELQAAQDREALAHTSRVATLGQLSAAIAHQLHQPLASIMLNAQTARSMLERPGRSIEEIQEILGDIVEDDARAADTIRNLQALYRQEPAQDGSVFDLNELIVKTLRLLRSELIDRGVAAQLDLAPDILEATGSRTQIQQVLLNLIVNAADAMAGAEIGQRLLLIKSGSSEQGVRLEVTDQGTGVADLDRIFEPFWTTKPNGVGVGLSICRAIVHAHGGTLTARNNPWGKGATFALDLPRSR